MTDCMHLPHQGKLVVPLLVSITLLLLIITCLLAPTPNRIPKNLEIVSHTKNRSVPVLYKYPYSIIQQNMSLPLDNSEQKTPPVPLENKTTKIEQLQRSTQNNINLHQNNGGGLDLSRIETSSVLTGGGAAQIERRLSWVKNSELLLTTAQQELIEQTQIKRMRLIEQGCETHPIQPNQNRRHALANFYKYRGVTWCNVPKTGTTNILRLVCIMIGERCTNHIGSTREHVYVPRLLQRLSRQTMMQNEQFSYAFVRNPWERLVSTYIQKFIYTKQYINLCYVNRDHLTFDKMKKAANKTWSFGDFISRCVIGQHDKYGEYGMEPHWRPQAIHASICDIPYNYIGKTETYSQDIKIILKMYGEHDPEKCISEAYNFRRENEKSGDTQNSYESYWESIDKKSITKIQTIYHRDLTYFDYPTHPLPRA